MEKDINKKDINKILVSIVGVFLLPFVIKEIKKYVAVERKDLVKKFEDFEKSASIVSFYLLPYVIKEIKNHLTEEDKDLAKRLERLEFEWDGWRVFLKDI